MSREGDFPRRGRSRSPRRHSRGGYRDRVREGYRSPRYDSRNRSRSRSGGRTRSPYLGGPPSRDVILEGLPIDMGEDDVGHHPSSSLFPERHINLIYITSLP